jgi:hypothetical protein
LALTCIRDRHCLRGSPLANFVCAKISPERITFVSHDIELGGAVVILGLDVLIHVEIGIVFVRSIVTHLRI